MRNLVATFAIMAVSMGASADFKDGARKAREEIKQYEQTYRQEETIFGRLVVRVFTQTTGPVATGTVNVTEDLYDAAVAGYAEAVEMGQCWSKAQSDERFPNHHAACLVDLGGGMTAVVLTAGGTMGMDVIASIGDIARNLLHAPGAALSETGDWVNQAEILKPIGYTLKAAGFVVSAAGDVVAITFKAVDGTGRSMVLGTADLVANVFDIPANVLRGEFGPAVRGTIGLLPQGACLVLEPVIGLFRGLGMLVNYVSGSDDTAELPKHCSADVARDLRDFKAGRYQSQPQDIFEKHNP